MIIALEKRVAGGTTIWTPSDKDPRSIWAVRHLLGTSIVDVVSFEQLAAMADMHGWTVKVTRDCTSERAADTGDQQT